MPMYQVKPISDGDVQVDLPTCMYPLPNLHSHVSAHVPLQNGGEADPALVALERRQEEILRRLYELKAAVDGLAKTATSPDTDLDLSLGSPPPPAPGPPRHRPHSLHRDPRPRLSAGQGEGQPQDLGALRDIVINAHPSRPPLTLLVLHGLLCQRYRVLSSVHVHSSVPGVAPPLLTCLGPRHAHSYTRQRFQLGFTLIWKDVPKLQMKFSVRTMCPIEGEANVARFLSRLLAPSDDAAAATATLIDSWVDAAFLQLAEGGAKERAAVLRSLNSALGRGSGWLAGGGELSLADIACYCCVRQTAAAGSAPSSSAQAPPPPPANVQRWLQACDNLGLFLPAQRLLQ